MATIRIQARLQNDNLKNYFVDFAENTVDLNYVKQHNNSKGTIHNEWIRDSYRDTGEAHRVLDIGGPWAKGSIIDPSEMFGENCELC